MSFKQYDNRDPVSILNILKSIQKRQPNIELAASFECFHVIVQDGYLLELLRFYNHLLKLFL